MKSNLMALGCGIAGGVLGYFVCAWLLNQQLYGLAIPGGMLGLGAGMVKNKSIFVAILCGLMATALGLFTEWKHFPFKADESLQFFVTHLQDLRPMTLIMIGLGGFIGFWVPFRNKARTYPAVQAPPADVTSR